MADVALAPATGEHTTDHLVAGPDRRFYAWVLDRLLVWGLCAAGGYAAYVLLIEPGRLWTGVAAIAGLVLLLWLVGPVQMHSETSCTTRCDMASPSFPRPASLQAAPRRFGWSGASTSRSASSAPGTRPRHTTWRSHGRPRLSGR